ncbi:unnamed protein product [Merluccius merluccius]
MLGVLCVFSLSVLCLPLTVKSKVSCNTENVHNVKNAIKMVAKEKWMEELTLYTPTIHDYEQKCPNASLLCFTEEMKVLSKELPQQQHSPTNKICYSLLQITKMTVQEPGCEVCELSAEETPDIFLEILLKVFQRINSNCSHI